MDIDIITNVFFRSFHQSSPNQAFQKVKKSLISIEHLQLDLHLYSISPSTEISLVLSYGYVW